jgi:hypothetical protein
MVKRSPNALPVCLLLLVASGAVAQDEDTPPPAVRLTLHPAAEPTPALKYRLLPEVRELSPGNAAQLYYRAFSPEWLTHLRPDVAKRLRDHAEHPDKVPLKEFRWVLNYKAARELDRAARRRYCDWELTERVREDALSLPLPDIQGFREFVRVLMLRTRLEMEDGAHDRVAYSLQTSFALARHMSEAPTLIHALVGVNFARQAVDEVREWVQKPNAPNLYWALSDLPRPLIDMRKPLQGERLFLDSLWPEARDMLAADRPTPLPSAQVEKLVARLRGIVWGNNKVDDRLDFAVHLAQVHPQSRRTLLARGWEPRDIDALPVIQTWFLAETVTYDRIYEDLVKWTALPYPQALPAINRVLRRLDPEGTAPLRSGGRSLAYLLLPAVGKVLTAPALLQREVDALRCVEALRLYAAAHDGKLPAELKDITEVPVPEDPVTGKPFEYRLSDGTATLSAPAVPWAPEKWPNPIKYEITLKK